MAAPICSSRLGSNLSWTLHSATRTRTLFVSLTPTERASARRRTTTSSTHLLPTRHFSTHPAARAEAEAPTTASPTNSFRKTSNYANNFANRGAAARAPAQPNTSTTATPQQPSTPKPHVPLPDTDRNIAANPPQEPIREIAASGLSDLPRPAKIPADAAPEQVDWASSFHGLSSQPFSREAQEILLMPIAVDDIEIKPDGILYLPEIKYRRILNKAFGPGGWGLAPRGETIVTAKCVTREYALLASGRLVSIARGEQDYFDAEGIPTATEGCKSNALMRCCKDLGVASELWDPRYIRKYMAAHAKEVWVEHAVTKKKKKLVMRKDDEVRYPFKEVKGGFGAAGTA